MKKKIGVDMDGVLVDQIPPILMLINQHYGVSAKYEDINDYSFEDSLGLPSGADKFLIGEYNRNHLLTVEPKFGAVKGAQTLCEISDVHIVTSRTDPDSLTQRWLERHNLKPQSVRFVGHKEKADWYANSTWDFVFEDSGEIAVRLAQRNISVVLFDAPWNVTCFHQNIIRVRSWLEVEAIVN